MIKLKLFSFLISFLIGFNVVNAKEPNNKRQESEIIFGPEWTFSNKTLLFKEPKSNEPFLSKVANVIRLKFSDGPQAVTITPSQTGGFRVTAADGVWFEVGYDAGVLEVQSMPLSLNQWRIRAEFVQSLIFDSMKEAGFQPHEIEGAGHINIGLSYFRDKPGLAKNFLLDYLNHPGVGIALNAEQSNDRDAKSVYQYLDDNGFLGTNDALQFLKEVENIEMDTLIPKVAKSNRGFISYIRGKAVAIGLRGYRIKQISGIEYYELLGEYSRFEMRQVRPQESFGSFLKVLEIFKARIEFLEKSGRVIKLNVPRKITDGWEVLGQFADYVEETGLSLKNYRELLPKVWRKLPEAHFIRNKALVKPIKSCKSLI